MSDKPFAYVRCSGIDPSIGAVSCGVQPLTRRQYAQQIDRDGPWKCPRCGAPADYEDMRSEEGCDYCGSIEVNPKCPACNGIER